MASLLGISSASADTREEFWPELDGFFKLDDRTRLFLMTSATRGEDTESSNGSARYLSGEVGAHLDYTLRPFLRTDLREEDWQHDRFLWLRAGYRHLEDFDDWGNGENRGLIELNAREPLARGFSLTGRVKWELRDIDGQYSNRYGVRLGFERPFSADGRALVPYAQVESLYDTRFDTWYRRRYEAGIEFEVNKRWRVEPYIVHQDDSRSGSAHINALGLTLKYSR